MNSETTSSSIPEHPYYGPYIQIPAPEQTMVQRVTTQFTSGKWLITMAAAVCIVAMVYTDCRSAMKQAASGIPVVMPFDITSIMSLLTMVVTSYFHSNQAKG